MIPTQRLGLSLAGCLALGAAVFVAIAWWPSPPPPPQTAPAREQPGSERKAERVARIEQLQAEIEAQRQALREARQQRNSVAGEMERLQDELSAIRDRLKDLHQQVESGAEGQDAGTTGGEGQ